LQSNFADYKTLPLEVELSPVIFVRLPLLLEFRALLIHTHWTHFPIKISQWLLLHYTFPAL
jgi:hypothetical protein